MYGFMMPDVSLDEIVQAANGDSIALSSIIKKYSTYIHWLSFDYSVDSYGRRHYVYNEELQHRLEAKLIYAIVTGYKVLDH